MQHASFLRRAAPALLSLWVALPGALAAQGTITAVSWNVESGGAQRAVVAERIRAYQEVDLWGLSEVESDQDAAAFERAAEEGEGADFRRITGTTGGTDRLSIVYDADRFTLVRHFELSDINPGMVRAPLVAHLRERATGREFLFMVNHLYRGNAQARHRQAEQLNAWGRSQTLPVIAVGDYNFDWEVNGGDAAHDRGYDNLTREGVFTWVRPATLVKTNCSPQYNSVLDFVFVNQAARGWRGESWIDVVPGDCPDGPQKSDHRPVRAVFRPGGASPEPGETPPTKAQILQRIERLEEELRALKEQVRRLPGG